MVGSIVAVVAAGTDEEMFKNIGGCRRGIHETSAVVGGGSVAMEFIVRIFVFGSNF